MSAYKNERLQSAIQQTAAEFVNIASNRSSLVTVTRVALENNNTHARVFVSVFPPEQTGAAIDFLSRQKQDFAEYFKKKIQVHHLPRVTFQADPLMGTETPPVA